MSELKAQHQRPEGRLIEEALKRAPKKSMRKLADEIGFSEGRIRQIINGYQSMGGQIIPIIGPTDTVASMAKAAGVAPADMRTAGREDVADAMNPLSTVGVTEDGDLWLSSNEEEFAALVAWTQLPEDQRRGSPPIESLVLWEPEELLEAAKHQYASHNKLMQYMLNMLNERPTQATVDDLNEYIDELEAKLDLSEQADRPDLALAADPGDDAAGETESYNET